MGARTQDLRSAIFHRGDPKLRGQWEKKSKVGYQFCDEPLSPSSAMWARLSIYPNKEDRSTRIPLAAFAQASLLLEHLGMPVPQTPRRDTAVPGTSKETLAVRSLISGIMSPHADEDSYLEDDVDDELEQYFGRHGDSITHPPTLQSAVVIAGNHTADHGRLHSRLDALEQDAEDVLKELEESNQTDTGMPNPSFAAEDDEMYPSDTDMITALSGMHGCLNVSRAVELRNRHDPPRRLNSEMAKTYPATLPSQGSSDAVKPGEVSVYLRQRRDVNNRNSVRDVRPRTINHRQTRWEQRRQHIARAYQSGADHFTGTLLSLRCLVLFDSLTAQSPFSTQPCLAQRNRAQSSQTWVSGSVSTPWEGQASSKVLCRRSDRHLLQVRRQARCTLSGGNACHHHRSFSLGSVFL